MPSTDSRALPQTYFNRQVRRDAAIVRQLLDIQQSIDVASMSFEHTENGWSEVAFSSLKREAASLLDHASKKLGVGVAEALYPDLALPSGETTKDEAHGVDADTHGDPVRTQ